MEDNLPYNPNHKNFEIHKDLLPDEVECDAVFNFKDKYRVDLMKIGKDGNLHTIHCFISDCYGPFQDEDEFIPRIILDKEVEIDTTDKMNFIYAQDVCNALYNIMINEDRDNTYEICSKDNLTKEEMISAIIDKLGTKPKVIKKEEFVHNPHMFDNAKLRRECHWSQEYSLKEGIEETIKWFRRKRNE